MSVFQSRISSLSPKSKAFGAALFIGPIKATNSIDLAVRLADQYPNAYRVSVIQILYCKLSNAEPPEHRMHRKQTWRLAFVWLVIEKKQSANLPFSISRRSIPFPINRLTPDSPKLSIGCAILKLSVGSKFFAQKSSDHTQESGAADANSNPNLEMFCLITAFI